MNHLKLPLLAQEQCESIIRLLNRAQWVDGRTTAGAQASTGKINEQVEQTSPERIEIQTIVQTAMWSQPAIKSFCLPRKLHRFQISKTSKGGGYDSHVDNAYMSSGRSDLSFTVCLSDAKSFEGGSLEVDSISDSTELKLHQGEIVIYPSTTLHRVKKVTAGDKLAEWDPYTLPVITEIDRVTLFQLDSGARGLLAKHGRSDELDQVFLAYTNLLRSLGT